MVPLLRPVLAAALVAGILVGGGVTSVSQAATPAPTAAPTGDPTRGTITWHDCDPDAPLDDFTCGTLTVPRDWDNLDNPLNASIELAVHKATSPNRIGAFTFNPGGPGESGLAAATPILGILPAQVRSRFDFVAWDPRGVGLSEPQLDNCLEPRAEPYNPPATGPVDWATLAAETYEAMGQGQAACLAANPDVAPFLGTYYVIRDLEAMRLALGYQQWNIWGMSYGTRIGFRYARQFPSSVRSLILDGSWSPNLTITSWMNAASWNYDNAQAVYSSLFGNKMGYRFQNVIDGLDQQTIEVEGQTLSRWQILPGIFSNISYQTMYPDVNDLITLAYKALYGKSEKAARQLRKPLARLQERAEVNPNAQLNINFINCRDVGDYPTVAEITRAAEMAAANNSVAAGLLAIVKGSSCAGLPADFTHGYEPLATNLTLTTPPVVINSLGDTRTEYVFGRTMANSLAGSSLITYNRTQHVSYRQVPSRCISDPVTAYLLTLQRPGNRLCAYAPIPAA